MGALDGIRVVDLTSALAGPFCTMMLGDAGADVIKVEPPGGDSTRGWGPPFWGDQGAEFLAVNRNKRSIVLDLKKSEARDALLKLYQGKLTPEQTYDEIANGVRPILKSPKY